MNKLRIAALVVSFFGLILVSSAQPVQPGRNNHCPPDPDTGAIICRASCLTMDSCHRTSQHAIGTYCWLAYAVSGTQIIGCHDGQYDACCDPNYPW